MSLTRVCVNRPVLVAMVMLGFAGIGIFCYVQLPQQMFPDVDFPMVTVVTTYRGAGPEEIAQLISKELEDEISTVEGIKHLRSISQQGMSLVMAEFYLDTDVDVAAADVRDKVNLVRGLLPEDADDPIVQKFDFNAQPILLLAVSADRPLREVFHMADERIRDALSTVPGVASVEVIGGEEREIHILTDQQRLRAYGLRITDVIGVVAAANLESPGGNIAQNRREYNIRLWGKFGDLEQIRNLPITLSDGSEIYLRDVADVEDSRQDIRDMVRADGRTCVGISVQKRSDSNTVEVDRAVREKIEELLAVLPSDYDITVQKEQASWITSSIDNVFSNMYIGILLTALALFLFLHTMRSVLIVSLTMPISVLATFIIMYLFGFTLNMMSLMGLAMTIGVLVNNAILVLENIVRYIDLGHSPRDAAVEGANEIAVAVSSTTLTNIVVFVPIAFMGGIVGQFFMDFGLTATFATIVSLFISFTLAPMMASRLLGKKKKAELKHNGFLHKLHVGTQKGLDALARGFDGQLEKLKDAYTGALKWCLRWRVVTCLIVLVFLIGSFVLAGMIGGEFITPMDQGRFVINIEMPTGTRLAATDEAVQQIEAVLYNREILPELVGTYVSVGRVSGGEVGGSSQAVNVAQIIVTLVGKVDRDESTEAIVNRLRPYIARANVAGANIKLLEDEAGGGAASPIQMDIVGDDIEVVYAIAQQAVALMNDEELVAGAVDVDTNYRLGQPEVRIVPDRDRCRDAQIDARYLAQVVAASFEGTFAGDYREGAYEYDIRVKNDDRNGETVADVTDLTIMNAMGDLIPLPQVADIETTTGLAQVFRKDRQSLITVSCDVSGRSIAEVVADIQTQMADVMDRHPGYHYTFSGDVEHMEESNQRMMVALVMAICLTYMLLAALLESFVLPILIMFSLPLSLIGVFGGLWLMGGTFSIFSVMSIVMLVGLVINNSIIVLDHVIHLRKKGMERKEAILEAGRTRLRPILMANLTTVVALIPLAMGLGWGGEMRAPMAMVQIGGLIAGGWMGLLVVPMLYAMTDDLGNLVRRIFHRGGGESPLTD
ncbi:MAG: efflux RND transporter permease subunit [Sedimentisphaerales bacterium]|nr:efflux RND transporter permease subunit [Sedimentisphaerales bacterium]